MRLFNSHGPQSSVYQTRVAGQFPSEANDTLIALRDIEAAVKRPHLVQPDDKPIVGLDIARFGDDKTVIIVRHGMRVLHIEELRKSDLVNTTGRVITVADEFKVRHIMIDEVGIGAGVLDTLKQDRNSSPPESTADHAPTTRTNTATFEHKSSTDYVNDSPTVISQSPTIPN